MEITLLIEAMDNSLSIIRRARNQSIELLNSAVRLTSETRTIEDKKIQSILSTKLARRFRVQNFTVTFLLLLSFWSILSGKFDFFHITLGVICSLIVSFFTHNMLFANVRLGDMRVILKRFFFYVPWLIYQIAMSTFHVSAIALSPKMPISPRIIRFKTKLESDISWVTLANSITLTPGTITMDIQDGEFIVHALDKKAADELDAGEMEDRIAHIYMEADHILVQDVLDVALWYKELKKGFMKSFSKFS